MVVLAGLVPGRPLPRGVRSGGRRTELGRLPHLRGDGEKRALTTTGSPRIIDRLPAFSPDGRTLAFLRGPFAPKAELFLQPLTSDDTGGPGEGRRGRGLRPDQQPFVGGGRSGTGGGRLARPTERLGFTGVPGSRPGASPWSGGAEQTSVRGTTLVFSTPEARLRVRTPLTGASKGAPAPFLRSTRGENHPAFSPDGRRVAFCSSRSGDQHIWVCDVDGSGCHELPLPRGSPSSCSPSWSPDGRRLVFDAFVGEACQCPQRPGRRRHDPPPHLRHDVRRPPAVVAGRSVDLLHLHPQRGFPDLEDACRCAGCRCRCRPDHAARRHRG